jgi:hypothetical protein
VEEGIFITLTPSSGHPYWRGRLCTVDLRALFSLDKLIVILKILFILVAKQATLMRSSSALGLPLQLVFLASIQYS